MRLSRDEIAALCRGAGIPEERIPTAVAVCLAESGGDPAAVLVNQGGTAPGSRDRGLWQINDRWHPEVTDACAYEPACATRAAARISAGGTNWSPWNAYKSGAYLRYLEPAMSLQIVQHSTAYCTRARPRRDPLGIVLHNTVTQALVPPHPMGSWHYEVDRDAAGTVHQYVNDKDLAWHVRACDEWRPPWCVQRDWRVSDMNSCAVGIEIVSFAGSPSCPPGYVPYTDAQYEAVVALLRLLYERYGPLPIVTHGSLQLDRTDPVGFDFARVPLVWRDDGYRLEEDVTTDTTPEERAAMQPYFEQLGVAVNMETALMKRAALAHKREETRGPAVSGEYEHDGHVRQDFSAGTADYDPATGGVNWVEINLEPRS